MFTYFNIKCLQYVNWSDLYIFILDLNEGRPRQAT